MAYEYGSVNDLREACLQIRFDENLILELVIDTGFSGWMMLPRDVIHSLQLEVVGTIDCNTVNGISVEADFVETEIEWLGEKRALFVLISESQDALIGTRLLDGARLTIDYIQNTVTLTNETDAK
jgi:clan AA aspartic protease